MSDSQLILDAFEAISAERGPGPYAIAGGYVSAGMHAGSIFEEVDNMSQRELDHLKGRECDPADGCDACNKIRAYYAALEEADEARNVDSNLQGNPIRDRSTRLSTFHMRLRREYVPNLGWIRTLACHCCATHKAHIRHWQKLLSKQIALRSHRPRKKIVRQ